MTLAAPLARALDYRVPDPTVAAAYPPTNAEILAALRADPATLAALAEALHEMDGLTMHPVSAHEREATYLADALFGATP